jgi:hypothetical protein
MVKRKSTKEQTTIYKHTHKTKDRVTRTPLKTGGELRCPGRATRTPLKTGGELRCSGRATRTPLNTGGELRC